MSYATDVSPLVLDLESAPLMNVRDYVDPPDLADIQAPSNYVKPEAIAGYVEREKAKRLTEFDQDCDSKAALDFNLARVVAIGIWTEIHGTVPIHCPDEPAEIAAIKALWILAKGRTIVGFRIREFDLPLLMQRSRYLGIPHPTLDLGRYARGSGICDLYDLLTFQDLRGETIMRRSLASFCRRFGISVDDSVKGKDIAALVAAGDWESVLSHVRSDVQITLALARRLGVVSPARVEAITF